MGQQHKTNSIEEQISARGKLKTARSSRKEDSVGGRHVPGATVIGKEKKSFLRSLI